MVYLCPYPIGPREEPTVSTADETIKITCRTCIGKTKHHRLWILEEHSTDDADGVEWKAVYEVLQCLGCENISFRTQHSSDEEYDDEGQWLVDEEIYPSRDKGRQPIDNYSALPEKDEQQYLETLLAVNNNIRGLAAIGIRSVIEAICIEEGTKKKNNIVASVGELVTRGKLSKDQSQWLLDTRIIGNEAAHDIKTPPRRILEAALTIVETLLTTMYVLPTINANMKPKPPRQS